MIPLIRLSPLSTPPTRSLITSDIAGDNSRIHTSLKDCIGIEIFFSYSALLSTASTFMLILRRPLAIRFVNSISSSSVKYDTIEASNCFSFLDYKMLFNCSGSLALVIVLEFMNLSPSSKRLLMDISKAMTFQVKYRHQGWRVLFPIY